MLGAFHALPKAILPGGSLMNMPPQTIVDVLIIFCHASGVDRDALLKPLENSKILSDVVFAEQLRKFYQRFIKPIKDVCKDKVHASHFHRRYDEVGRLTASLLVPLITLVLEDYRIEVDTPQSYQVAKASHAGAAGPRQLSGKEQVEAINALAKRGDGFYRWQISPFAEDNVALDVMPQYQYRLTQLTTLLDSVGELISNYRSFLIDPCFQTFLKGCLGKVKEEYNRIARCISAADDSLSHGDKVSRSLQAILGPMLGELTESTSDFELAIRDFERVVSAPDFVDKEQQLLSSKLAAIDKQFTILFDGPSGLQVLLASLIKPETSSVAMAVAAAVPMAPIAPPVPVALLPVAQPERPIAVAIDHIEHPQPPAERPDAVRPAPIPQGPITVDPLSVAALRNLIIRCHDTLSYQSKLGRKGELLTALLNDIPVDRTFTPSQIKHAVLELVRVTASYNSSLFFHAEYGQSRSAKELIKAIKDIEMNRHLPLSRMLFEEEVEQTKEQTDLQIEDRLKDLRTRHQWQPAVDNMLLKVFWDEAPAAGARV